MIAGEPAARASETRVLHDLYVVLAVFVVAWIGCRIYLPAFRAGGGHASSYYDEFGPAVMAACGRGFVNPTPHSVPALDVFLLEKTRSFDCRLLDGASTEPLDNFQAVTRNLLLFAAAVWRVTGVSWTALDNVAATMFSVTLAAAFLTLRFAMGPALAVVGTLVWAISPMHLGNVAHLRDYSKAPFFVLTGLAVALAYRAQRLKTLVALGAAFGVVQGIGLGMRTDVVLNFAPFLVAWFAIGSGDFRKNVKSKLAGAAASLLLFVVVAWPVLKVYSHAEGLWHVSLLGLTTPFDAALNLRRAPYDFGYLYDDSYISTVVQAYWYRVHDSAQVSLHNVGLYDKACKEYYRLILSTFPADFLTRMAGSALHVVNLPFFISSGVVPVGVTNPVLTSIAHVRSWLLLAMAGTGPALAAWLLILIGIRDRIAECVAFAVLIFYATYPYLQFHDRHVFHLEILTISILLWAVRLSWQTIAAARSSSVWTPDAKRAWQSASVLAAFVAVGVMTIAITRAVQEQRARAVFGRYAKAPEERVDVQQISAAANVASFRPALFEPPVGQLRIQQAMLELVVTAGCSASEFPVHVRYQTSSSIDFSRDLMVDGAPESGSLRVFVPVYSVESVDGSVSRFTSVDIPPLAAPCVRLVRARALEREPLMLDAVLAQDWQSQPLAQRLYIGPFLPERVWLRVARWLPRVAKLG